MVNVFIIHGHDHLSLYKLKDWLRGVSVKPIVLMDEAGASSAIMEKFEKYANQCEFAIALLTPDDKQASELESAEKFRARQNVIFEMGWFMGKLGRRNVVLIHKGQVELPSDVLGILYLPFKNSITEVFDTLRSELVDRGLIQ